jgi:hypothetical protein
MRGAARSSSRHGQELGERPPPTPTSLDPALASPYLAPEGWRTRRRPSRTIKRAGGGTRAGTTISPAALGDEGVKGADREGEEREGQRRVGEERRGREAAGRRADGSEAAEGVGGRVWGSVELISIYTGESGPSDPKIDSPCVVVGVGAAGVRGRL